jgi:hypothetical protein
MNPLSDLERLVAAIEHQGANIAPTYQEYMPIAFATANDCGEAGRTFFHRICRLSEKYVYEEADIRPRPQSGQRAQRIRLRLPLGRDCRRKNGQATGRHLPPIPEGEQESFKPSSPSHTHTRTYVRT